MGAGLRARPTTASFDRVEELSLDLPAGRLAAVAHGPADGPLVLCVHGLSANARAWDALAEHLAADGRRVVAVDVRGRGLSEAAVPGGLDAHAADVVAAATALGAETFDLAGWSMGALIGILAAGPAAGRLRRLILIDHAGRMDDSATAVVRAGLDRLDAIVADPADHVAAVRAAGGIEQWSEQWDAVYRRELREAEDGRWVARTSRSACERDLIDMLERDWEEAWRRLTQPTLLVRSTIWHQRS